MRIAKISDGTKIRTAILEEGGSARIVPWELEALIAAGDAALADLQDQSALVQLAPGAFRLVAPYPSRAKNVFCVGRNYMAHVAEGDRAQKQNVGVTEVPVFFTKPPTAITDPDGTIPIFPHVSTAIDYEVELGVVIGKPGRDIPPERAMEHVFGYTIVNDISARDVQRRHGGQYFKGKGLDGSCPIGPVIVTADAIGDPHALAIRCSVNGELRQDGNTRDMVFNIPTLIASLSQGMTLEPGDILATGTPSGVGYAMDPPRYLQDGDSVTCEIEGIGRLTNVMRLEGSARQHVA
ncbi:fumarylacetoacetate hydrolase family protein [Salipiger sp. 1_MG-2023]|uniref:fumarylacetoacetate hydrolase family protein n=1 Tax=Salipiger sp. 1_MG-2023 TaxID=3062665 RepID=UPI0026E48F4E|nr:fumarylacetoacetate hydrolase family protein [Salipiger sp. 1_MG-2023]MDO6587486.1 fumarylacetoacetate hydrolase family protein [Salipiger sp. 1_MG-2023]